MEGNYQLNFVESTIQRSRFTKKILLKKSFMVISNHKKSFISKHQNQKTWINRKITRLFWKMRLSGTWILVKWRNLTPPGLIIFEPGQAEILTVWHCPVYLKLPAWTAWSGLVHFVKFEIYNPGWSWFACYSSKRNKYMWRPHRNQSICKILHQFNTKIERLPSRHRISEWLRICWKTYFSNRRLGNFLNFLRSLILLVF